MSSRSRTAEVGTTSRFVMGAMIAISIAVLIAWSNSYSAPFELDDDASIANNASLRDLASFRWLFPPAAQGETVGGRPFLNLSFALDYAAGGLDVRWYHATNLAIHLGAALVLFGLIRRTLARSLVPEHFRRRADSIAFAVALLWSVHPLVTQAVTYVVQRAESLMSLLYLLTLYTFCRATAESKAGDVPAIPVRSGWLWASLACCTLGMASKENMVSAPFAVLLYDRAFVTGTFAAALRRRPWFYAGLAATWVLLGALVLSTGGNRGGSAGFDVGVGWTSYVLTQFPALVRYVALCVWPHPLVFEYGDFAVTTAGTVALPMLAVLTALVASVFAIVRCPRVGFVVAVGWAVLAPTSLVPGTLQMIVEHRMYLPLAAVLTLAALAVLPWLPHGRRAGAVIVMALAAAGVVLTWSRNAVYASPLALWADTAAKRPDNPRAHNNLGLALQAVGRTDAAVAEFRRAIALQPNHAFAHANLGNVFLARRQWAEAEAEFSAALTADPHFINARVNLAAALAQLGRRSAAIVEYRKALAADPTADDVRIALAALLTDAGGAADAEPLAREALSRVPDSASAHLQLGRALEALGRAPDAFAEYRTAAGLAPRSAEAHVALGNLYRASGDADSAVREYREAIRLSPNAAEPHFALGNALAAAQQFAMAMAEYRAALEIDSGYLEARSNLANCQLMSGSPREAIANYELVLKAQPENASVQKNLRIARALATQAP